MKIIIGKDYYDNANYGIDPAIIFVRDGKTVNPGPGPMSVARIDASQWGKFDRTAKDKSFNLALFYIFFAGDVYPGLRVFESKYDNMTCHLDWPKYIKDQERKTLNFFYDYDEAKSFLEKYNYMDYYNNATRLYDHFHNKSPTWTKWLVDSQIVTGYLQRAEPYRGKDWYKAHFNSMNGDFLGDWEFFKVKGAFEANQDIANYVGGVLPANANPMIELSNKIKIVKAGFDTKTSFRKGPTKHLK